MTVVAVVALALFGIVGAIAPRADSIGDANHATTTATTQPVAVVIASPAASAGATAAVTGASPTPQASATGDTDTDDESGAAAGSSFVPTATGALPPSGAGSPADRLPGEPDPTLTPGALNPAITQSTIHSTICVSGWTATIRPSESYTNSLKVKQIGQYGYTNTSTAGYEEDHLISLELGGAPADARNLWPEPYTASLADGRPTGAHTKDGFETKLKKEVCAGALTLAAAQAAIGDHWVHAYYSIALSTPVSIAPPAPPAPAQPVGTPVGTPYIAPAPAGINVAFTTFTSPAARNSNAVVGVQTAPGAGCSIVVEYKSGPSKAAGLGPQTSDSNGAASWTWKVGVNTTPGSWPVTVTCTANGSSASATQDLQVD
jgi:hypothetical protein